MNLKKYLYTLYISMEETKEEMTLEIKPEFDNSLLKEFSKKYKPEELTDDGIPNLETQLREISDYDNKLIDKFITKKDIIYRREMLQRVKCLALDKMGKHYMINTNNLTRKEKNKLQEFMHQYNDIDHEIIIQEFNDLVCNDLDDVKTDISKLPIYDI